MAGALAVDDGLSRGWWLAAEPYVLPLAIVTAPERLRAIKLPGAFSDAAEPIDAGLDRQLPAALDGVDLLRERIQPGALAGIGEQPQLIAAAARCDGG